MDQVLKKEGQEMPEQRRKENSAPEAVYIHIPFCTNKCFYCDFNSYVLKDQPVMDYLRALDREMELTTQNTPPEQIKSIFVGGGTPTVLGPQEMEYFLSSVRKHFGNWSSDIEFTMEANPGTTDLQKLAVMKDGGVNRVSFGVQAFQNELLSGMAVFIIPTMYIAA